MTEYIRTPNGDIYKKTDCEIFTDEDNFLENQLQEDLAVELFEQSGILVANVKGGENNGKSDECSC